MAGFAGLVRRRTPVVPAPAMPADAVSRLDLPPGFEAVAEALAASQEPLAACAVLGRAFAREGASLGEALAGLRTAYTAVLGREPDFAAAEALCVAWGDSTLEYVHQMACEDPLTGLASMSHMRARLDEIYREAGKCGHDVRSSHALVLIEIWSPAMDPFSRALLLAQIADAARSVFSGGETIGKVRVDRAVVITPRRSDLGTSVTMLRSYLADLQVDTSMVRVWIEGLPSTRETSAHLMDELAH